MATIFGFTRVQPSTAERLDTKASKFRDEQDDQQEHARFLLEEAKRADVAAKVAANKADATEKAFAIHVAAKAQVEQILSDAGVTL